MNSAARRWLSLTLLSTLLTATACAGDSVEDGHAGTAVLPVVEQYSGLPSNVDLVRVPAPSPLAMVNMAGWTSDRDEVAVVLYGSSSCPPAVKFTFNVSGTITVEPDPAARPDQHGPCTADYAAMTYIVSTEDVDAATPLRIDFGDAGAIELP